MIGAMAERSRGVARTEKMPMSDASTPMPITTSGIVTPKTGLRPMDVKAPVPRMSAATRITP